ncbi:hypothetical protein [Amycolatopsis sp. NPDC006125]|uniref:hypothetical protein n=1 Tax=Amycolatopsis sp. NPDC006125 TaxID=3156730 RepID=UPI0033B14FBF
MATHNRRRALQHLHRAELAAAEWADDIRQGAEARVGSHEADAVITDALYNEALDLYRQIRMAAEAFAEHAARIERGGR